MKYRLGGEMKGQLHRPPELPALGPWLSEDAAEFLT